MTADTFTPALMYMLYILFKAPALETNEKAIFA
jgi:hypothetical protein